MEINTQIIKHYLKNVMFITGTAYAGKSTMARMLSEAYGLYHCGENYDCIPDGILTPDKYPNLSYFDAMKDWQEFVNRTPEEYEAWIYGNQRELAEFEISFLMSAAGSQKVIVDTNIPLPILREIAEYNQVAVMLCPQSLSVGCFFDRGDPDKAFIKEQIMKAKDPEKTMQNYLDGIARINSQVHYEEYANSGFFVVERKDAVSDTRRETLALLAKHFGLTE